ncbi:RNA polymerase sigma factor [Brevibacillus sp. GCM10020057]|uniref:RNA polymerase sigma factor n=1 Tax=Brevibacillus sp. GCM10020057 TaxID=3317327 RepID=UPI0036378F74
MLDDLQIEKQFTIIYEAYYRDVYHFFYCFTGNQNDAEDLTQEAFLQVISSLPRFEGRSHIKTWLFAISKNIARSWYRKRKFFQVFLDPFLSGLEGVDGRPESELMAKENSNEVLNALRKLKATHRMVFILRCVKDCSVRETAEILKCSEAKVKVDYHRACKMLAKALYPKMKG